MHTNDRNRVRPSGFLPAARSFSGGQGRSFAAPPLQLMAGEEEEIQMSAAPEEEEIQMSAAPEEEELQMKSAVAGQLIQQRAASPAQPGAVPPQLHAQASETLGQDLSSVRIHPNSQMAPSVGALAFTQGEDIHFAPGQFDPASSQGRELIGHELAHVVQQREGRVQPTGEVGGLPLNDDTGLEQEADAIGRKLR
ncbi:MAG: DUF4157 domain-containing protein [Bacteroidia bacterium]|nr:DUF4157 domain-containing protein [Bacteroidia bacterium]